MSTLAWSTYLPSQALESRKALYKRLHFAAVAIFVGYLNIGLTELAKAAKYSLLCRAFLSSRALEDRKALYKRLHFVAVASLVGYLNIGLGR